MKIEEIKSVVVRGTNWVGDAAMSVPALRELRRILPEAHITLSIRKHLAGLFEDADFIDEILIYEKQKNSLQTIRKQAKIWRERKFDLAVLFPNSFESALLAKFGKANYRIGYKSDGRGFLLNYGLEVPQWKNERHEVFYYLNIISELERQLFGKRNTEKFEPNINFNVSENRKESACKILSSNGVSFTKKLVALCPGSTNSRAKRWGTEKFAELADLLSETSDVILIGAPDELEVSQDVWRQSRTKPILLTGKTSLAEVVALLSVSDLLVTNDTGPAHLAPAVGTETIVIFGPTVPTTTKPFSNLAEIVRKPPKCAPCMLRDCPIDHRCMKAIMPEEVFRHITTYNFK